VLSCLVLMLHLPCGQVATIMALCGGDGFADIVGRRYGSVKLPWWVLVSWFAAGVGWVVDGDHQGNAGECSRSRQPLLIEVCSFSLRQVSAQVMGREYRVHHGVHHARRPLRADVPDSGMGERRVHPGILPASSGEAQARSWKGACRTSVIEEPGL
jgi:hypothetical protein